VVIEGPKGGGGHLELCERSPSRGHEYL